MNDDHQLACRFDEECRGQVADGLKGRGIHLYPETSPTRYVHSHLAMLSSNLLYMLAAFCQSMGSDILQRECQIMLTF